ncbi:hypothetical protein F4777DRAFT_400492 [Nemania sp. FL0916]|nr:hypothetical protein F4777DRAFT_400492 [Nemania sp. FL0916]
MADDATAAAAPAAATTTAAPTAPSPNTQPNPITLRAPSKYLPNPSIASPSTTALSPFVAPPVDWLHGTWTVTHSTLSMWRSAQNVRITYAPHDDATPNDGVNDNIVEYEKKNRTNGRVRSVLGVEKPDPKIPAAWNWRGKGWLAIASSHWEVLGWGERPLSSSPTHEESEDGEGEEEGVERWAVTWFAPTLFTEEGVDLYSDRRVGLQKETADAIIAELKKLKAPKLVQLVEKKMMEVAIKLPWKERD